MHQRTTDPVRIARAYERGMLTELAAANDIIECTVALPSRELVSALPPELLARIRELADGDMGGEAFLVRSRCGPTATAADLKAERDDRVNWLIGQALWRDYFKATPDQPHDPARQ